MNVNNNQKQQTTICPCGGKYTINNKSRHLKTEKHQNYLTIKDCLEEIEIERQIEKFERDCLHDNIENNHLVNILEEYNWV
jgi:hypothetical protein